MKLRYKWKKNATRVLSMIMAIMLVVLMMPSSVYAKEGDGYAQTVIEEQIADETDLAEGEAFEADETDFDLDESDIEESEDETDLEESDSDAVNEAVTDEADSEDADSENVESDETENDEAYSDEEDTEEDSDVADVEETDSEETDAEETYSEEAEIEETDSDIIDSEDEDLSEEEEVIYSEEVSPELDPNEENTIPESPRNGSGEEEQNETPIIEFSADDKTFIESDDYELESTNYFVKTEDEETYYGPLWEVMRWLNDKYPDHSFDCHIDDNSENPSNGDAGDTFRIAYYLDGLVAEWTLSIVANPVASVTAYDRSLVEGSTFTCGDYDDDQGHHEVEWQKYDFAPRFKVVLTDGSVFDEEYGDVWQVVDWFEEKTGIRPELWWDDTSFQNPPAGYPAPGEYQVSYGFASFIGTYKATITANPIQSVEVLEGLQVLEGDRDRRRDWFFNEYTGQDEEVEYEAYPTWPNKIRVTAPSLSEEPFEGEPDKVKQDLIAALGISEDEFNRGGFGDDYDNQFEVPWEGVGVHHQRFNVLGVCADYDVEVVYNPVTRIVIDQKELLQGTAYLEKWDWNGQEVEWYRYDAWPDTIHVFYMDGEEEKELSGSPNQLYDQVRTIVGGFNFHSDMDDDQDPDNLWTEPGFPYKSVFYYAGRTNSYTAVIVESPIQSVTVTKGRNVLEGDKDSRDRYWDEEKEKEVWDEWYAYGTWPDEISVQTSLRDDPFVGNPDQVRRDLAEALGKDEEFINRRGFGDINDNQSPTNPWGVGTHHQRFEVMGVYGDYDVEVVKNPIQSLSVEDKEVFLGDTHTERWTWGPEGQEEEVEWERYDVSPRNITVTIEGEDEPLTGNQDEIHDRVMNITGIDFWYGDEDPQNPDNRWTELGDYQVDYRFAGVSTTFYVHVVDNPIQSVEVLEGLQVLEGDTGRRREWRWNESTGQDEEVTFEAYDTWPNKIRVTAPSLNEEPFEGHPNDVRRDLAEALGVSEDELNRGGFGDENDNQFENPWQGLGVHHQRFNVLGVRADYEVEVVKNPVTRIVVDEKELLQGNNNLEKWDWNDEEVEWYRYDAWPDTIHVFYMDGEEEKELSGSPEQLYDQVRTIAGGLNFHSEMEDEQDPDHLWTEPGVPYNAVFYYAGRSDDYTATIVESPIQSITVTKGRSVLEGDTDTRDRYWDEQKEEEVREDWQAYGAWPNEISVQTSLRDEPFVGDPNDVRRDLAEALGKDEEYINRRGFGNLNDDQTPTNQWGVGIHHLTFEVMGVYADYDIVVLHNPVKSVSVEDKTVFYGNTDPDVYRYWDDDLEMDVEIPYDRYNVWPSKISVVVETANGDKTISDEPNSVYDQVKQIVGVDFWFGDDGGDQFPDETWQEGDGRPNNTWDLGDHEVGFRFAGREDTYTVTIVSNAIVSVSVDEDVYLLEGDTYDEYGYWDDVRQEWVGTEEPWQKYGYMAHAITVVALVNGNVETFTGDAWYVRDQVAEALNINPEDLRVEVYDNQSPDNLWTLGNDKIKEYGCILNFAGTTADFRTFVVAFPVASISVEEKILTGDDIVDFLDNYIDPETGDIIHLDENERFDGYDAYPNEITAYFKDENESPITGNPDEVCATIVDTLAAELGIDELGHYLEFPRYFLSDQVPNELWSEGYHKAEFHFGPVSAEYDAIVLGPNGDYTGLHKTPVAIVWLEHGFPNEEYTGLVEGSVASSVNAEDPYNVDVEYIDGTMGLWYVEDGFVASEYTGLKRIGDNLYYLNAGRVDNEFEGLCKDLDDENSPVYYVKDGAIDNTFTGPARYTDNQKTTLLYLKNGVEDSTLTDIITFEGKKYFFKNGKVASGWQSFQNYWYYMDSEGVVKTGWLQLGKVWYYLDGSTGKMVTGWRDISKAKYYFDTSGAMQTGWKQLSGVWYYFNTSGEMIKGWKQLSGVWYYFDASGAMQTGWKQISGTWYYFNTSGAMQTGWRQISGAWYYFNTSGAMRTGWFKDGSVWYYFTKSGEMKTGWLKDGNTWYYFTASGAMKTGWLKDGGQWYYFDTSGAMVTGTKKIGSKTYKFNSSGVCLNP